jgi:hypothetical protein
MRGRLDPVGDITVVGEATYGGHREIRQASPEVGVLVLTIFEDDDSPGRQPPRFAPEIEGF